MKRNIISILFVLCFIQGCLYGQNTMATAYDFGILINQDGRYMSHDTRNYTKNFGNLPTNDVFYKFQIQETRTVTISHCGSAVTDTYVYLLNQLGQIMYENNDTDGSRCASKLAGLKVSRLPAGTYYIVSKGFTANGVIATTVEVSTPVSLDPIDIGIKNSSFSYSDTKNTALYENSYGGTNAKDVTYKFTLTQSMTISVSHCGSQISNTYISLLNSYKNLLHSTGNNSSGMGDCYNPNQAYLNVSLSAGTYYVVSEGQGQDGYIVTTINGGVYVEHNIGAKNAAFVYSHTQNTSNSNDSYGGRANDVTYKFTLGVPMDVTISHCGSGISSTQMYLLNEWNNQIGFNDYYQGYDGCTNPLQAYLKKVNLPAGTYTVISEGVNVNGNITTIIEGAIPQSSSGGGVNQNYISVTIPAIPTSTVQGLTVDQSQKTIMYFDGLGRQKQEVQVAGNPSKYDLVSTQEYDTFGRESSGWLPAYALSGNNGAYVPLSAFKNRATSAHGDTKPYSQVVYEPSPLNRVSEQYAPGADWHDNNRSVKISYMPNLASNDTLNCIYYTATSVVGDSALIINKTGNYASSELSVIRMEDEDGNASFEFKDKLDQVVLVRQIQRNGSVKDLYDTYYIYDDFGNQLAVLPPEVSYMFKSSSATSWNSKTDTDPTLRNYAYLYKYDHRNRCIAKKLPGCGWIYYIYDSADRLIFLQDGEQRRRGEWTFSIYDVFGRLCLMGICKNTYNALSSTSPLSTVVTTERNNTNSVYKGYTNPNIALATVKLLTVNYYDDQAFLMKTAIPEFYYMDFVYSAQTGFGDVYSTSHKTLPTGILTARLDDTSAPSFLANAMYYDYKGQLVQSISSNHLGGYDKAYYAYNFNGQLTKKKQIHSATGKSTQTEVYSFEYDHAGRLLTTRHQLNSGSENVLAENTYDNLGRLKTSTSNNRSELKTTYNYNIRSWINQISSTFFTQSLTYHFNGNIKAQQWEQAGKIRNYTFGYDNLNRLKSATYTGDGNYGTTYTYDKHGNITNLSRYGNTGTSTHGLTDNLTMAYSGNQLIKVTDTGATPSISTSADFRSGSAASVQYLYDANGNLKQDLNKGIGNIVYNSLNLPGSFTISNSLGSATNTYVYSADGRKLKVTKGTFTTDYCGNVIYENGSLKRILVDGGYYENGTYYFYLTDHLGNNRVVANQSGSVIQSTQYYPFGMAFADGTNPSAQPYKFGGKELDSDRGLNLYDFHARWQDPTLGGRFLSVDPLAEKYYSVSPYVYCANNPMRFVDPTGMDYWSTSDPNEIARFLFSATAPPSISGSLLETFNFSSWNHATDAEFTGNLTFNDETNTFYSSYGYIGSDGTPIIVGVSIKATNISETFAGFDGPGARWYNKASGRIDNVYPEFSLFFGGLTSVGRSIVRSLFSSTSTMNTFNANQSGFVSSGKQKEKMGQGRRNMSSNHEVQNKQIDDLAKKYGLTKNERRQLHDIISGEGYGYHEIEQIIKDFLR